MLHTVCQRLDGNPYPIVSLPGTDRKGKVCVVGEGNSPRNFVSVENVARFVMIALERKEALPPSKASCYCVFVLSLVRQLTGVFLTVEEACGPPPP